MRTGQPIYFDYQASTPVDPAVLREMLPYFTDSAANPHSADHAAGWAAEAAVQTARNKISKLIGCDSDEIIFTSGATESNNLAIIGLRKLLSASGRRKIVTSSVEHKSVLAACLAMTDEFGADTTVCKIDGDGNLDLASLNELLSAPALLLTIGGVNSETGGIRDIERISAIALRHGVLVHIDAAQMPQACDISTLARHADMVSLSGHKMYGPKGVGCLYVRRGLQADLVPLIFGGGQQNGLRSGTVPVPLCVGMGVAAELAPQPNERDTLRVKTSKLWDGLRSFDDRLSLNGPALCERHPGNLNVRFAGIDASDLIAALQPHLAVSTGSACTSGTPEASYVLRGIGLSEEEARSSIRFSLGRFTTDEEIQRTVELVEAGLRQLENCGIRKRA